MLSLALTLLLSQTPSTPEAFQRFDAERKDLLPALAAKYACEKPGGEAKALCAVALTEEKGTVPEIRGKTARMGLTWNVRRAKGGKVEVSAPRLSALALNKDSVGVWGTATDQVTPQNAAEKKMLAQLTKDYVALLDGRKASVSLSDDMREFLAAWAKALGTQLVEKKDNAWAFKGAPNALRKVGERWVIVGVPRSGEGLLVSVFAD
jgi:hypothetical protein